MSDATARIAELRERLRQLDQASGLDGAVVEAIRREAEEELRRLSNADEASGPVTVRAEGRSVAIGRDAHNVVIFTGDGHRVAAGEAEPELLYEAYLAWLAGECCQLPLAAIDTRFVDAGALPAGGDGAVRLPEVYVELDVTSAPRRQEGDGRDWAWRLVRGDAGGRTPILEALTGGEHRCHVLLGDPGSGKTTFAHYLCYALAVEPQKLPDAWSSLVPLRFVLRELAPTTWAPTAERVVSGTRWRPISAPPSARRRRSGCCLISRTASWPAAPWSSSTASTRCRKPVGGARPCWRRCAASPPSSPPGRNSW